MFVNGKLRDRKPEGGQLFSIVLAGDLCPWRSGEEMASAGRAAEVLAPVRDFISRGDLAVVQWETPLATVERPIPKSGPNLNCLPVSAEIAVAGGFDVALLANNHIGDQGAEGVLETITVLRRAGLATVGAGPDRCSARAPLLLDCCSRRIAIFNFAENEFGIAGPHTPGAAPQSPLEDLAAVRKTAKEVDFTIVALHGGHEYNPFPSPRLVELCRAFAEAGAGIVFNCHTHCPEGVEFYNGTAIIYSPGNFFFPKLYGRYPSWRTGYLTRCCCDRNGAFELELCPYRFDNRQVTPLDAKERELFFTQLTELCLPIGSPERLRAFFEAWCTQAGPVNLPEDWETRRGDPGIEAALFGLRNQFSCESHHDLIRCRLRQITEGRGVKEAELLPLIRKYQDPPWMHHN